MAGSDRRELDDGSRPDLPAAIVKGLMVCGHHRAQENDVQRSGAQLANDTLSVAWLRGTFGRDAGPSSADFLNHMDWL